MWKDIKEYEGFYQVDENGNVRSLPRLITTKTGCQYMIDGKTWKSVS